MNWGPIPELAAKLCEAMPGRAPGHLGWKAILQEFGSAEQLGSPWGPFALSLNWPAALTRVSREKPPDRVLSGEELDEIAQRELEEMFGPEETAASPFGGARVAASTTLRERLLFKVRELGRRVARIGSRAPQVPRPSQHGRGPKASLPQAKAPARHLKTDADLARTLVECYAWLSALATDYLARLYAPFWNDLPAQLACVSWRALDWALLAWELDGDGATTITQHSLPPALGAGALLGDALCLHLHIETLVASLPARLAMRPRPNPPYRRPGGLRTSQFLSIYSGLSSPDAPRGAAAWLAALNSLIRSSPLTRAVYADLVGFDTPPAGRSSVGEPRPQLWAWLADLPVGIETDLPSTGTLWGNQLWYSHLARSLLGALISQPAAFDALLAAEERLRQLEGRSRGRSEVAQPWPTSASADLEAIRRQCDELRHRWAAHIAERLAAVGATLRATQGAAGMPYVHLRLLDMLVRHVTTASMHGMLGEWHKVDPAALPRPGDLFDTGGACFRTLQQLLLGQTLAELVELLDNDHRYMLRSGLQNLLNPAGRPAAEDLAAQASVPEEWAGYLIARFFDGPMELPLIDRSRPKTEPPRPLLNREGPSPARLLADEWLDVLLRHLPLQSVTQIS